MRKGYQVGLLLLFLGFCTVFFNFWPKTSEQWASWVQAVGSIAAIGVAIALARDQGNKQRQLFIDAAQAAAKDRMELRIEQIQGAGALLASAVLSLEKGCVQLRRAIKIGGGLQYSNGPMLRLRDAIQRIPLHESPYCVFATEVAMCDYQIEKFIKLASGMAGLRPSDPLKGDAEILEEIEDALIPLRVQLLEKTSTYDGASPVLSPGAKV